MKRLLQRDWNKFFRTGKHCLPVKLYEKKLLDELPINAKVIDLGCGDASLGIEVSKRNLNYIGIDYSAQAIKRASINLKPYPNTQLIQMDVNKLPIEQRLLNTDLIFIRFVLAHIDNKRGLLETAQKLLRPGGKIFILSPTRPVDLIVNKDLEIISLIEGELEALCKEVGLSFEIINKDCFPDEKLFLGAYLLSLSDNTLDLTSKKAPRILSRVQNTTRKSVPSLGPRIFLLLKEPPSTTTARLG